MPYSERYNFVLVLLNPEGNDKRDNLDNAALDTGESMVVDFQNLYKDKGILLKITVTVTERTNDHANVHIRRKYL